MVSVAIKEALKETGCAIATHASRPSPTATSEPVILGLYRQPRMLARKGRIQQRSQLPINTVNLREEDLTFGTSR